MALKFSEQLRVIRVHLRCTQKELATRIGISPGAIFKYENNQMNPTLRTIAKVEDFIKEQKLESILSIDGHTQTQNREATLSIQQQNMLIELQAEKIKHLEKKLKSTNRTELVKPAYHFKCVSRYEYKIDKWYTPLITGDVSMTGYTLSELHTLCSTEGKPRWLDRYHPDSLVRLDAVRLNKIKTDYLYTKWEHMMWKSKNGKYECYNIDQVYSKEDQEVTAMFYWVNGNKD